MVERGIIDCTLREGDQAPGVWFDQNDKMEIFQALDRAGVTVVDAGMPAISEEECDLLRALASLPSRRARVAASVRAKPEEIELAAACGVDEVFIIFPVSDLHLDRLGLDRETWALRGTESLKAARHHGLAANLVLEDASRANAPALQVAAHLAKDQQVHRVMLCDTVGLLTPARAHLLVHRFRQILGDDIPIGTHFHDDFGMASANTIAALEAGAAWPSVTVNGIGERAGNAVLAEVAAAAQTLLNIPLGIALDQLQSLSDQVEALSGIPRSPHAPLVGHSTYHHESGIHVDGILKDPRNYEPIPPCLLGRRRALSVGKHTGFAGLKAFAEELEIPITDAQLRQALLSIKTTRPPAHREAALARVASAEQAANTQDAAARRWAQACLEAARSEEPEG